MGLDGQTDGRIMPAGELFQTGLLKDHTR